MNLKILSLIFLLFFAAVYCACPAGWSSFNGRCYYVTTAHLKYIDAVNFCASRNATLPIYYSDQEFQYLQNITLRGPRLYQWAGIHYDLKTSKWLWMDGTTKYNTTAFHWVSNKERIPAKTEKYNLCAGMYPASRATYLLNCNGGYQVICQKPANSIDKCDASDGWLDVSGKCYKYFSTPKTWRDARASCQQYSGDLAVPISYTEQLVLGDVVPCQNQANDVWVGISDITSPGRYLTVDSVTPPYQRWNSKVRYPVPGDSCVSALSSQTFAYESDTCVAENTYICQKPYGSCAPGWIQNNGSCYKLYQKRDITSWFSAQMMCQSQGTNLVIIESADEQKYLAKFIKSQKLTVTWIGCSDYNMDNTQSWVSGVKIANGVYTHWHKGYPRPYNGLASCGSMLTAKNDDTWANIYCFTSRAFICESSITNVPHMIPGLQLSCDSGWSLYREDCYYQGHGKTRDDALSYCQSVGAILTTIRDPQEQAIVIKMKKWTDTAWFGLSFKKGQNVYAWDDYTPPTYTNWYPKEPDRKQPCVQIVGGSRAKRYIGSWEDTTCNRRNNFICRKSANGASTTTPSGVVTAQWSERCGGPGWIDNQNENTCYQINTERKKWADARKDCQNKGGDLMSISGPKEQIHLEATLSSSQFSYVQNNLFIGGSDRNDEGGWEWSDGSPFRYLNWHTGEPNMLGRGQNCMVLTTSNWHYTWDNTDCSVPSPYICKRKPYKVKGATTTTALPSLQKTCKPTAILSGTISLPDERITASSSAGGLNGASSSRITRSNKGWWSPLRNDILQTITANFYTIMIVKAISTMGRPDNTQWVTQYKLQYQLDMLSPWYTYQDPPGTDKIFSANKNGRSSITNTLAFPIEAKSIRLNPVAWHSGIALKWEILGCMEEDCDSEYALSGPLIVQDGGYNASSFIDPQHSHEHSRLVPIDPNEPMACWKPNKADTKSYIEVTLNNIKLIRGITTMGNPDAREWVTGYKVAYLEDESTDKFKVYQEPFGVEKVFRANRNSVDKVTNMFKSYIQAKKIRIMPTTIYKAVALRFDVLVCAIECQDIPLISGDHKIADEQLSASSQYDNDHGPMRSRLNLQASGDFSGGWLAEFNDNKQYIQVDLGATVQVVAIATQGRKERNEFVRSFTLAVSTDGVTFYPYYTGSNVTVFDGNYDAGSVRKQYLKAPVMAGYIQLWPVSWEKRIALRWEVYGCPGPQSNYKVGCYADRAADRDLPYEAISDPEAGMWPPMCIHHCYLKGYYYAGLQNRDYCYCGNSYGKYGAGLNCSLPCTNRAKLQCGGKSDNLVYTTGLTSATRVCADGWMSYNDRCYITYQDKQTWKDARTFCQASGSELVSIADQHEQDFVMSLLADVRADVWIGFNDLQTEMYFEWSNDEEVLYTNWNLAQPANPSGTQEDCVLLTYKTGGWQDERCDIRRNYICEMEKQPSDLLTQSPLIPGCDQGWDGYENSCYLYVFEPRTWSAAARVCRSNGGTLLQISDKYEQAYISSKMGSLKDYYWTDVTDSDVGGTYIFADGGSRIPLTNWARHKPDQKGQCVSVGTGQTAGLWFNMNCTTKASAVCEKLKKGVTTLPPVTTPDASLPCPDGWTAVSIWCYQVNNVKFNLQRTWGDAQIDCQQKGAQLASFHNQSDLDALYTSSLSTGNDHFWIGLNDLEGKGYVNSDGTAADLTAWATNEPNNYQGTAENCVEVRTTTGKFNDQACSVLRNWICGVRKGVTLQPVTTVKPPTPGPAGSCSPIGLDDTWKSYNGNCYLVVDGAGDTARSWRGARDFCRQQSAELSSISTEQENLFLWSQIVNITSYSVWIGLNELNPDKGPQWSDSTPFKYINWNLNEPNDYLGLEACVDMFVKNGKWNDEHCNLKQAFICKRSLSGTTQPTQAPVVLPGYCPTGFNAYRNKCFKVYGNNRQYLNYSDASAACRKLGTGYNLAAISNPFEGAFLTTLLPNVWWTSWLGMTNVRGSLFWDDNEDSTYFNWAHGEPSNKGKGQQCVIVFGEHGRAGQWGQAKCSDKKGYVCQTYKKASITTIQPETTSCDVDKGFRPLNKDCVILMTDPKSWDDARTSCKTLMSDLASLNNRYEQAFAYLIANENTKGPFWIGLNDKSRKGQYTWSDNWPVTFTNWGDNQPNVTAGTGCVSFASDGSWKDDKCATQYPYFCKKTTATPPVTPAPGTGQCPGLSYQKIGTACYSFDYKPRTFDMAVKFCAEDHARLISLHDNTTDLYIYNFMSQQSSWAVWLGSRRAPGGSYKWLDGSPVNYEFWNKGEPKRNDSGGEELLCGMMTSWSKGSWTACPCTNWMGTICQRSMKYDNSSYTFPTIGPAITPTPMPVSGQPQTPKLITPGKPLTPIPPTSNSGTRQPANFKTFTPNNNHPFRFPTGVPITPQHQQGNNNNNNNNNNNPSKTSGSDLGGGAIAGIVIGSVAVIGILILGAVFVFKKRESGLTGFARSFSNALYESGNENEGVQFQ